MTSVDWQHGQVTSISDFRRAISAFPPRARRRGRSPSNCIFSSIGLPSGSVAVRRRSVICMRRKSKRWPKPATNASSGTCKPSAGGIDGAVDAVVGVQPDLDAGPLAAAVGC